MRSVIISYGHLDPVLPLYKYLRNIIDVDLLLVFSQKSKRESLLSFEDIPVKDGLQDLGTTRLILERIGLKNEANHISIFIYHNNRIRTLKNLLLSIRLSIYLFKYKIVHVNGQNSNLIPLYYLLTPFKKKLFTVHDYKPHTGEEDRKAFLGCYWMNKFLIKSRWPVVIQNKADISCAKKEFPQHSAKMHFIPFGIFENYQSWFDSSISKKEYDLICFGRISPYKGIDYLLQAIKKVQDAGFKVSLCIAGSGDLSSYKTLMKGIENLTVINQYVQSSKLVGLIQKSGMVVCPYTDATQSGVAMTAFALEKPVLASNVGGFPEVIIHGKTGYLVYPKNSDDLAASIQHFLDNPEELAGIKESISNFMHQTEYDWHKIAHKYVALYKSLYNNISIRSID